MALGSQNGAKMRSKNNQKNVGVFDRSWKGSGAPKVILTLKSPRGQGPRGGMKDYGLEDCWKEDASKPPTAQRAGGTFLVSVLCLISS